MDMLEKTALNEILKTVSYIKENQECLKRDVEILKIEMNRAYKIVPKLRKYSLLAKGPKGAKWTK